MTRRPLVTAALLLPATLGTAAGQDGGFRPTPGFAPPPVPPAPAAADERFDADPRFDAVPPAFGPRPTSQPQFRSGTAIGDYGPPPSAAPADTARDVRRRSVRSIPGITPAASPGVLIPRGRGRSVKQLSWTYIEPPEPRVLAVHDIITVLVDEKSEVTVQSRFDRQKTSSLVAELKEFVRLDDSGRLVASALNQPTIDAAVQARIQANGNLADREGIRYRIAAEVVDVLPNGNVVLEARKSIRSNRDVWEYTLTGTLSSDKVNRDLTAVSEDVANLRIEKRQQGKIYDSTKRGWGLRMLDKLIPF